MAPKGRGVPRRRRRVGLRTLAAAAGILALAGLAVVLAVRALWPQPHPADGCRVSALGQVQLLDLEQADNVATITAVALRRGLPAHAATVALAAAFQESHARNLRYGDRDSVGIFQQRPSQGWGSRERLLDPAYAASRFYDELVRVPGWAALPVTEAAQRVQRSAAPSAYAGWEATARLLAVAFSGQSGPAVSCRYARVPSAAGVARVRTVAAAQLGAGVLDRPRSAEQGWQAANWAVAKASTLGVVTVTHAGQRWTRERGSWQRAGDVSPAVAVTAG